MRRRRQADNAGIEAMRKQIETLNRRAVRRGKQQRGSSDGVLKAATVAGLAIADIAVVHEAGLGDESIS
jgi:hypothetical protein